MKENPSSQLRFLLLKVDYLLFSHISVNCFPWNVEEGNVNLHIQCLNIEHFVYFCKKLLKKMKKSFLSIAVVAILAASCQQAPEAANAETSEKQEAASVAGATAYSIDTTSSIISWIGTKPVGKHHGDFKLASGSLSVENGAVKGGNFVIDIHSMKNHDLTDAETNGKLVGHLKSADFFDAEKFPTAKFEITGVEALQNDTTGTHKISGNLTLKDSTKNVTFPAKIVVTDNNVKAVATFNIDRTNWGLRYGNDQSLGDKFIRPEVNIALDIEAKK